LKKVHRHFYRGSCHYYRGRLQEFFAEVLRKDLQQPGFFKALLGPVWTVSQVYDIFQDQLAELGPVWDLYA
jgi:hypothetical protein